MCVLGGAIGVPLRCRIKCARAVPLLADGGQMWEVSAIAQARIPPSVGMATTNASPSYTLTGRVRRRVLAGSAPAHQSSPYPPPAVHRPMATQGRRGAAPRAPAQLEAHIGNTARRALSRCSHVCATRGASSPPPGWQEKWLSGACHRRRERHMARGQLRAAMSMMANSGPRPPLRPVS